MKLAKLLKSVGCAAVLALSASQSSAGLIVASSDTNLNLGPSGVTGLNTFYSNMFSGADVFATTGWSVSNTQSYMAANSGSFTTGLVNAAALAGKEWFVASTNSAYSASELSDIASFVANGGNLFVLGEHPFSYASMNTVANTLLAAIGSSMTIGQPVGASSVWGSTGANIGTHALTAGITSFGGNYAASVIGGTSLFKSDETNLVMIAVESTTSVPEPTTLTLFGLGLLGLAMSRRRKQ